MAETELHLMDMIDTIQMLEDHFADQPNVYVCGNLLLYYEEGNPRKHVAPDVFVAFGVPKEPPRENYLVWKEGKAPDFVVEITSKSTRREDKKKKFGIYRDILRVSEYFLFDPTEDYLDPAAPGFSAGRRRICSHRADRRPVAQPGPGPSPGARRSEASSVRSRDRSAITDAARGARGGRAPRQEERRRAGRRKPLSSGLAEENERLRREIEALRRR